MEMKVEYKNGDILEHVADGRRVEVVEDSRKDGRYAIKNLATDHIAIITLDTLRRQWANLTAQEEGRYRRERVIAFL